MPDNWYYISEKKKYGPCTFEQLKSLAAGGRIRPADMVLSPNDPKWVAASSVPGLFGPTAGASADPAPDQEKTGKFAGRLKKLPLWVWLTAGPAAVIVLCCGCGGVYGFISFLRAKPQTSSGPFAVSTFPMDSMKGGGPKGVEPKEDGIDADDLTAEFKENKAAAEKKYLNNMLHVRNAQVFMVTAKDDAVEVVMDVDSQPRIMCKFTGANKQRAMLLKMNDLVSFEGKLTGVLPMSIWFDDCEIVAWTKGK